MTRLEGSDCADTDALQEAGTRRFQLAAHLESYKKKKKLKYKKVTNTCVCARVECGLVVDQIGVLFCFLLNKSMKFTVFLTIYEGTDLNMVELYI